VSLTQLTTKKVDYIGKNLCEYEAICKKALTCVSEAQMELFDEKNQRSKISWQGPLNPHIFYMNVVDVQFAYVRFFYINSL
jgi:hypothetical protein